LASLVHLNGRVYDPLIGKFLSGDPFIAEPTNGQNYNRYSYVLNNPTNSTDPTGFITDKASGCLSCEWTVVYGSLPGAGSTTSGDFQKDFDKLSPEEKAAVIAAVKPGSTGSASTQQVSGLGQNQMSAVENAANNTTQLTGSGGTNHGADEIGPPDDWRENNKADQFLKSEYENRGKPFCTSKCSDSDVDAQAAAANRYTGASQESHRETQWWIYKLNDSTFTFTYPSVTRIESKYGPMPDLDLSIGALSSGGHSHWDGENKFSGTDFQWLKLTRVNGSAVKFYLSSGDGTLKYSTWNSAKEYGIGPGLGPQSFPGIVVKGVTINSGF
jgi:RHS repeat-associated protein